MYLGDVALPAENADSATWSDTLQKMVSAVSQGYLLKTQIDAQKKLTTINADRVSKGLLPLTAEGAGLAIQGPSVTVGVSSDVKWIAGLGVAAILGYALLSKRR